MQYIPASENSISLVSVPTFFVIALSLTSCMNNNMTDLDQYIEKQRSKAPEKIEPLPAVKSYSFYAYNESGLRNPFVAENTGIARSIEECPQITRTKDALETIPLDSLILVGSLEQNGERWALIKDPERNVHRLKKGEYMGQNNGQIMKITDSEVVLQELVSDRLEGCQKRKTILAVAPQ